MPTRLNTDYDYEDLLKEAVGLHLKGQRRKNSKGPMLCVGGFFGQADSSVRRDGLQPAERLVRQEDARGDAARLRDEDRLIAAGLLHSMSVGGNLG